MWVDAKDSGLSTPAQITVEKGFHKVTVRKTGFKDASMEDTVAEGQTMSFSPVLLSVNPQSEDGIRDYKVTGVPDVCSSDLTGATAYSA